MSPRKKNWSFSAGEYPHTVRVFEREPGGMLYAQAWDPTVGYSPRISLRHRDQEQAITYAETEAAKLRDGSVALAPAPNVIYVTMQYFIHQTPKKALAVQKEDERRIGMWRRVLGPHTQIRHVGRPQWESFIALRGSGAIDCHGAPVAEGKRTPVSERTVDADLVFMVSVFNWATSWNVNGRPLLERNPWGGTAAGVKRALERPKPLEQKQPVASFDRFLTVRAAAERVMMVVRKKEPGAQLVTVGTAQYKHGEGPVRQWMKPSYLPELMDLVEDTGRRITAICRLWYSDFIREGGKVTKVRWRSIKGSKPTIVPIGERARAAIERVLAQRPGIGDRPAFPSPRNPDKAITRFLARDWLERAEDLAEVEHVDGGDFHPYRRKWATERKHHPDADVMEGGGWTDPRSLKRSYQKADSETVLAVINEQRKLREQA